MNYDTCIVILQCMAILWLHNGTLPACGCSCGSGRLWLYTQRVYRWSSCVWYCVLVGRNYMWKRLTIMLMYSVWCHSKTADKLPNIDGSSFVAQFQKSLLLLLVVEAMWCQCSRASFAKLYSKMFLPPLHFICDSEECCSCEHFAIYGIIQ